MEKPQFRKKEQPKPYEYFIRKSQREDIYQFSRGVTKYLHDEKIPNIILLDRSPRAFWVGIDEYWKEHYKKEKRPNIYFINPDGFNSLAKVMQKNNYDESDLLFDRLIYANTGESEVQKKIGEEEKIIMDEFNKIYSNLVKDKDKPIAIFDNCLHSGQTILPVLHALDNSGYRDLRVVIGDITANQSPLKIDKHFTDRVQLMSCGAFGTDFGVEKDEDSVVSHYDQNANRERVIKSREEIRRIVKEKGAN